MDSHNFDTQRNLAIDFTVRSRIETQKLLQKEKMNNNVAVARFEEAPTWVCWDIENFPVPRGYKAEEITEKISLALRKLNYRGPISISAYGNMNHIPPSVKKALSSAGIVLNHFHMNLRKSSLDMVYKIWSWRRLNPAPANVMFISQDGLLSITIPSMQSAGYNILLAHPPHPLDLLVASVKTTWLWKSLLKES
ncbi:hypothetical protein AALP_AA3G360200 [Arabis alpina]|uniref:NYN domain-containing protein n=1 Tax=Arabis alpina TaxID=50452 RepID=A0A087HDX5_ARAAL|nr:hypothetical protein AALP_AA3G360200 [Arabis alpina]